MKEVSKKMAYASAKDKKVPDGMMKRKFFQHVEQRAESIRNASNENPSKGHRRKIFG